MNTTEFQELLRNFYTQNGRDMPWRNSENGLFDPYKITVSEIMLQQTQVDRVIPKFNAFIETFPTIESLADASLQEVLQLWSGLGYNRRAKYLHEFAKSVSKLDVFPKNIESLSSYTGIGINTAAAILNYTYNTPYVFVETNIRTVMMNHFFEDHITVSDKEILLKVEKIIDNDNPREFYWSLMDYGSFLKKQGRGKLAKSSNHKKQSKFDGSVRQLRGKIIALLSSMTTVSITELKDIVRDDRSDQVLQDLKKENMITIKDSFVSIAA